MPRFLSGKLLSSLSTFGIGGPARYYIEVKEPSEAVEALHWAKKQHLSYFILGKGSNCLFDDRGFDGLVIHMRIDFCHFSERLIYAGAGYSFSLLGVQSARRHLSGLEFASGIPGSVGGAVYMNAGANRHETCNALKEVLYLDEEGNERLYIKNELRFSYRSSSFQQMNGCILAARFELQEDLNARSSQLAIVDYRLKTQPYKEKSAGCIFRNPTSELSAGALIDQCGLKGASCGKARISEMHANFIVNSGGASSQDVCALIQKVQAIVAEKSGVYLEPEVRRVSYS